MEVKTKYCQPITFIVGNQGYKQETLCEKPNTIAWFKIFICKVVIFNGTVAATSHKGFQYALVV